MKFSAAAFSTLVIAVGVDTVSCEDTFDGNVDILSDLKESSSSIAAKARLNRVNRSPLFDVQKGSMMGQDGGSNTGTDTMGLDNLEFGKMFRKRHYVDGRDKDGVVGLHDFVSKMKQINNQNDYGRDNVDEDWDEVYDDKEYFSMHSMVEYWPLSMSMSMSMNTSPPTEVPSDHPSDEPSTEPSSTPSEVPTDEPSVVPTTSYSPSSSPSWDPTTSPSDVPSSSPTLCGDTITEYVCSTADLSTLCELLIETDLDAVFDIQAAIWTMFAPTNDAFETVAGLLPLMSVEEKTNAVLFHVTIGETLSEELICDTQVLMFNGLFTETLCFDDELFQVGPGNTEGNLPQLIQIDIPACNGVIHVVDNVILLDGLMP